MIANPETGTVILQTVEEIEAHAKNLRGRFGSLEEAAAYGNEAAGAKAWALKAQVDAWEAKACAFLALGRLVVVETRR